MGTWRLSGKVGEKIWSLDGGPTNRGIEEERRGDAHVKVAREESVGPAQGLVMVCRMGGGDRVVPPERFPTVMEDKGKGRS